MGWGGGGDMGLKAIAKLKMCHQRRLSQSVMTRARWLPGG